MTLIEEAEKAIKRLERQAGRRATNWRATEEGKAAALIRRMADELRKAGEYVDIERLGRG